MIRPLTLIIWPEFTLVSPAVVIGASTTLECIYKGDNDVSRTVTWTGPGGAFPESDVCHQSTRVELFFNITHRHLLTFRSTLGSLTPTAIPCPVSSPLLESRRLTVDCTLVNSRLMTLQQLTLQPTFKFIVSDIKLLTNY